MKIYQNENDSSQGWEIIQGMWGFLTEIWDVAAPVMEQYGLHQKTLILLALLDTSDTPQAIAHRLRSPASTVSHLLRELEEKQLIVRSLDPQDRRRFRLRRTEQGETALREGMAAVNRAVSAQMAGSTPDEQDIIRRAVTLLQLPPAAPGTIAAEDSTQ